MKKIILLLSILFFSMVQLSAQEDNHIHHPMLGDRAPSFTAESTTGTVTFPQDYIYKWKILFSHPADFTPVCTSEILELAGAQKDFNKLGTEIVVVSTDKLDMHTQWVKSIESIRYKDREPVKIEFPLVSDVDYTISKEYGMLQPSASTTKDVRGVFIVDPKNKIRAIFYYPMNIGRNLDEIERTLIALQTADKQHVLIPGDWQPGGDVLLPVNKSSSESEKQAVKDDPDYYQLTWYMQYKKGSK
jgi:peroxiredoxin (alkyl hydroperoxide reductase subunit C)